MNVNNLMAELERKHPGENEYLQAVREVLESIEEVYNQHPEFEKAKIVERLVEPDRIFTFRVTWVDDKGEGQTNLGYRVQFNSAIGPYKGGLRFHKAVNPSMLKFLGFETSTRPTNPSTRPVPVPPTCRTTSTTTTRSAWLSFAGIWGMPAANECSPTRIRARRIRPIPSSMIYTTASISSG